MITKEMIRDGLNEHLIRLVPDPNGCDGTVCKIEDGWFYFGGREAADMTPEQYSVSVSKEKIINEIFETLEDFRKDADYFEDEYEYYESVLTYRNGYSF